MKHSQLKQLIKEEIRNVLNENKSPYKGLNRETAREVLNLLMMKNN